MMNAFRKKLLFMVTATMAWAAIQPGILSAQSSGVAGDGSIRLMWKGTDSSIFLWKLDTSDAMNLTTLHLYGPYFGWSPIAVTTNHSGYSYVLWRYSDGTINLWEVDPNLNFYTSRTYGPYNGYTAESLSVDTNGVGDRIRLIWRGTDGSTIIWIVDGSLNFISSATYGPFLGYSTSAGAAATDKSANQQVDKQAAAAMNVPSGSVNSMPMPGK
jgi:WD40 repeat protein